MPERRKIGSPGPAMTSTPKMKRKDLDKESPTTDMKTRLGFTENGTSKKEFSQGGVEFTEYNDGTTRPIFKKRLKNVCGKTGELSQLECVVSGSPLPKVLWLKNSRALRASDECKVVVEEGTNTLVFLSARSEDVGTYTARAMNVNGSIMCSADFTLVDGRGVPCQAIAESPIDMDFTTPAYFFEMASCEVAEGRLARFDCRVVAHPKPEIVWMRDGKVIEAGNRFKLLNFNNEIYSLLIKNVSLEDTGRYTCWARNKFGEAMTEAYLNVTALKEEQEEGDISPKFITKFYDQQTIEGTATDFKCLIGGRPEPTVTWLFNNIEIKEMQGIRIRCKKGALSLEIKSPRVDQSGSYTCLLKNSVGEAKCSANLTIVQDKLHGKMLPRFLKRFDHVNIKEGEDVKFSCVIVGEPKPNVTWLFDYKPLSDVNRRFQIKVEGDAYTLIIKNVRFDDMGIITCKAVNEEGEVYCTANLHVRESMFQRETPEKTGYPTTDEVDAKFGYGPTFTKRLQDMQVKDGSRAVFECKVMGIPEPEISWMKDGRGVINGGRYHISNINGTCELMIENVTQSDTGVYTCIISNTQGKSSSTAELKLEDTIKKERYTPEKRLDEKPIKKEPCSPAKDISGDRIYLDINRYKDESRKVKELPEIRAPPRLPKKRPIITDLGHETVRLAWRPAETYQGREVPQISYKLEAKELPGKDWSTLSTQLHDTTHYLSELQRDRDYMFRVRAENDFGVSEPTEPLWLPRARAFPGVPVARPQIFEIDDTSAKLSWTRVDVPTFAPDDTPLLYMLEVEEPSRDWRTIARDLDDTDYIVEGLRPGRDYRFRVRAKTPTGIISEPSPTASLFTALARSRVPINKLEVLEYELDTRSAQLAWQQVHIPPFNLDEEPLLYMIEYQEPPLPDWKLLVTGIPTTRYRVTHLDPLRDYNFRVRAVTSFGTSPPSATLPVTLRQPPVHPRLPLKEPTLQELTPESVELSWQFAQLPVSLRTHKPIHFGIEMAELPSSNWVPVARGVQGTQYNVTGLRHDRDYKFRVFAETESSVSEPSPPVVFHRRRIPRFAFKEPTVHDISQNLVHLSWQSAEIPQGYPDVSYMVEMQTPPKIGTWNTLHTNLPMPSVHLADLRPDLDYLVRVRAQSGTYLSEPTLPVYISRRAAPPQLPYEQPYAVDITGDSIKLQWRSADLPTHIMDYSHVSYIIEVQDQPNCNWTTISRGIPHTDFKVTGLKPDRDYAFRVRAENEYGISDPTRPMTLKRRAVTPILPKDPPLLYDVGPKGARLTWRPATLPSYALSLSPITYTIYIQELPFKTWRPLVKRIPHTCYYISDLPTDKNCLLQVRAENKYGSSQPTASVCLLRQADCKCPISKPEISDFADDLTSAKLHWKPTRAGSLPDRHVGKYTVETWEPVHRKWRPIVTGIPDTSYRVRGLSKLPDHLFRIRLETEQAALSEPSLPVSVRSYYSTSQMPIHRPQLYELDSDTVRISWQPVQLPSGISRRSIRYTVEQRKIPDSHWLCIAYNLIESDYKIRGLCPKSDYEFRVRAIIQGAATEPSNPVSLFSRAVIPKVQFEKPEVYDVEDTSLSLRWNTVNIPAFASDEEPLLFVIERQTLPDYEWHSIATDITDKSYTVRDLKPYQDYNFRVRGMYPSGYTDPSPYVPVYRRPNKSHLGHVGIDSTSAPGHSVQKYAPKIAEIQMLPSQRDRVRTELSSYLRKSIETRLGRYSHSPSPLRRRYSVASIYDATSVKLIESPMKTSPVPAPKFKREDAYVYKRALSPTLQPLTTQTQVMPKKPEFAKAKPDRGNDLYEWYRKHRRYSDVGLEDTIVTKTRYAKSLQDEAVIEKRMSLLANSERRHTRRASISALSSPTTQKIWDSEASPAYASVADRYEDIKCPYIVEPGHWRFPRRHSVALDNEDIDRLTRLQKANIKTEQKSRVPEKYRHKDDYDLIRQTPDEYFGGTHFTIEDEVKFSTMKPMTRASRADSAYSYHSRSISQDKDPGYFMISRFSLSVGGVSNNENSARSAIRSEEKYRDQMSHSYRPSFRSAVSEQRYVPRANSWTPDYYELKHTRSLTPDRYDLAQRLQQRSDSLARELMHSRARSSGYNSMSRSSMERSTRTGSPSYSSLSRSSIGRLSGTDFGTTAERQRSYSVSIPSADRKFNRVVEDSKSLITNYERLEHKSRDQMSRRGSCVGGSADFSSLRSGSVPEIKRGPIFSATPRGSMSGKPAVHKDLKTDPRFTTSQRASVSFMPDDRSRSKFAADGKTDARFTDRRRATVSSSTNEDLRSMLDTMAFKMPMPKPKSKKSSRPVMKYKSSRGEGVVMEA